MNHWIEIVSPIFGVAGTFLAGIILLTVGILLVLPQMQVIVRVRNRRWLSSSILALGVYFVALSITSGAKLQPYDTDTREAVALALRVWLLLAFDLNIALWLLHSVRKQVIIE